MNNIYLKICLKTNIKNRNKRRNMIIPTVKNILLYLKICFNASKDLYYSVYIILRGNRHLALFFIQYTIFFNFKTQKLS